MTENHENPETDFDHNLRNSESKSIGNSETELLCGLDISCSGEFESRINKIKRFDKKRLAIIQRIKLANSN